MHEQLPPTWPYQPGSFEALQEHFLAKKLPGELTAEQEVDLAQRIGAGKAAQAELTKSSDTGRTVDTERQSELMREQRAGTIAFAIFQQANQGLVKTAANLVKAKNWHMPRVELEELEDEGNLLLAINILRFDPSLGNKFSSYGLNNIINGLITWVHDKGRLIRLSRGTGDKVRAFRKLTNEGVDAEAAAEATGFSLQGLLEAEEALKRPDAISYDHALSSDDDDAPPLLTYMDGADLGEAFDERLTDILSARTAANALRQWLASPEMQAHNDKSLDPERTYAILIAHYGRGRSMTNIASDYGISHARVSQIIRAARKKIVAKLPDSIAQQIESAGYTKTAAEQPRHPL
ncbi:MAG TPA: sigma-70 family RNA polymerase sigma factor [Candidatus Saccharimonadales bacterium]|nr:sigma-70 family RNA polymerase sigma factor [Candidatus Saccharimonadales bacterium]